MLNSILILLAHADGANAPDFDPDAYSMGRMTGANYSCPYNVTEDMWTAFRAPGTYNDENGIRAFPYDGFKTFTSFCRCARAPQPYIRRT